MIEAPARQVVSRENLDQDDSAQAPEVVSPGRNITAELEAQVIKNSTLAVSRIKHTHAVVGPSGSCGCVDKASADEKLVELQDRAKRNGQDPQKIEIIEYGVSTYPTETCRATQPGFTRDKNGYIIIDYFGPRYEILKFPENSNGKKEKC